MAGYIGSTPVPQGIQEQQSFTATAGQTTFNTLGYTDGNTIRVTLNGVLLEGAGVDYTASNGSDIVLTAAASADDVLTFETFNEFQLVSQTMTTPTISGGTLKSNVTLKNDTEQDTDGGRASKIIYQGEQSGGEISTLAEIEASHDGTADDEKGDLIFRTNDGSDGSSPTEAMRIDSSQHVLIGKTSTSSASTVDGIMGLNDGRVFATTSVTTSTEAPFMAARTSTAGNGKLIDFKYNGTSVGDISVDSSDNIQFGATTSGGAGFYLHGSGGTDPFVLPMKEGALSDNTVTLGDSSRRYKDLYLSGGAYIGGTVAANYLDDYEEGTWTIGLSGLTVSGGAIETSYVKVGNQVTAIASLANVTISGGTNSIVTGLPFTSGIRSTTSHPALYYHSNGAEPVYGLLEKSSTNIYFQYNRSNNSWASASFTSGSNRYLHFSITYTI